MEPAGILGRYKKPNKADELRIHFASWILEDGREVSDVTVFPHPCSTCVGGDHMHVEVNDTRERAEVLEEGITLSSAHKEAIDRFIVEKLALDELTREFAAYVQNQ